MALEKDQWGEDLASRERRPDPRLDRVSGDGPTDPSIVYAGTNTDGVYRSSDGGASWVAMNNGLPTRTTVFTLLIDPSDPQTVYAGGGGSGINWVFKTTDGCLPGPSEVWAAPRRWAGTIRWRNRWTPR